MHKLFMSLCCLSSLFLMSFEAFGQEDKGAKYAPNFRLSASNPQQVMQLLGTPDAALLQFVGVNPRILSYNLVVVMGSKDNLKKEIRALKSYQSVARGNNIGIMLLYTDLEKKSLSYVKSSRAWFPILDDPYFVVRSRYEYIKSQYCYIVDYRGKLIDQPCNSLDDLDRYFERIKKEES